MQISLERRSISKSIFDGEREEEEVMAEEEGAKASRILSHFPIAVEANVLKSSGFCNCSAKPYKEEEEEDEDEDLATSLLMWRHTNLLSMFLLMRPLVGNRA